MANQEHLDFLGRGVAEWNEWRAANPKVKPDLSGTVFRSGYDVSGADLSETNMTRSDLSGVTLNGASLRGAVLVSAYLCAVDLTEADLTGCDLTCANLMYATLQRAVLDGADLTCANFARADLAGAKIRGTKLYGATLAEADLEGADLSNSQVYGVSVWRTILKNATQTKLSVTPPEQACVTVDHLEIAQFIALVIQNSEFKAFLDTVANKIVLLLGRFSAERKPALDALKSALALRDYVPVIFDFEGSELRDETETIMALAHMSKFIIADITEAKSVAHELGLIIPDLLSVPVLMICAEGEEIYPLALNLLRRESVVKSVFRYRDAEHLTDSLDREIIEPLGERLTLVLGTLQKIKTAGALRP